MVCDTPLSKVTIYTNVIVIPIHRHEMSCKRDIHIYIYYIYILYIYSQGGGGRVRGGGGRVGGGGQGGGEGWWGVRLDVNGEVMLL